LRTVARFFMVSAGSRPDRSSSRLVDVTSLRGGRLYLGSK
jgi:hypothetical protein